MYAEILADFFRDYSDYAFIISIALSVLISLSGILPSFFITAANILVFGTFFGFFISWLGETLGAAITFFLYRLGLRHKATQLSLKYPLLQKIMQTEGFHAGILILEGRLLPFIPSGFITAASSISKVSFGHFIFWTFIGKVPSLLLESLAAYDLINLKDNYIRLSLMILIVVFIHLSYRYFAKRVRE